MLADPFAPPAQVIHTNGAKPMPPTPAPHKRRTKRSSVNGIPAVVRRFIRNNPGRDFTAEDVLEQHAHEIESGCQDVGRAIRQFLARVVQTSEVARVGWGVYIAPGSTGDTPKPKPAPEPAPKSAPVPKAESKPEGEPVVGRRKGAGNKHGMAAIIRRYIRRHPGKQITTDDIIEAHGPEIARHVEGDLGHAIRQTLARLHTQSEIGRVDRGVYLAPGAAPKAEPVPAQRTKKETEPVKRNAVAVREDPAPAPQEPDIIEGTLVRSPIDAAAVVLANALVENLEASGINYTFLRENGVVRIEWMRPER